MQLRLRGLQAFWSLRHRSPLRLRLARFEVPTPPVDSPIDNYPDPVIPLMESLPFPWDTIEGVWQAKIDGQYIRFSFEVRSAVNGRRFLHVVQVVNPSTSAPAQTNPSEVVAFQGDGWIDERTNAVRAGMLGERGTYMLFIGLYKNEKVEGYPRLVTMLTARSFQSLTQEFSVMIEKIQPNPVKVPPSYDMN